MAQLETKSTFPTPPPFWRMYGKPELTAQSKVDWQKPPPPPNHPYTKFNNLQPVDPTIPSLPPGVKQMYEVSPDGSIEFSTQLRRLNSRVLPLYTSLLDQLVNADVTEDDDESNDPANQYSNLTIRNTLTEISHVFLNEIHLLALCRRHQALQSLIQMMKKELSDIQAENQSISQSITESRDLLAQHGQFYSDDNQSIEPDMSSYAELGQQSIDQSISESSESLPLSDADKLFAILSNLPDQPIG